MQEYREKFYKEKAERQFSVKETTKRKPKDMEETRIKK